MWASHAMPPPAASQRHQPGPEHDVHDKPDADEHLHRAIHEGTHDPHRRGTHRRLRVYAPEQGQRPPGVNAKRIAAPMNPDTAPEAPIIGTGSPQ